MSKETVIEEHLCVYFTRGPGERWEFNSADIEEERGSHSVGGCDAKPEDLREAAVALAAHVPRLPRAEGAGMKHLGGPMPAVGTKLCAGWKERAEDEVGAFRVGTVIAAGEVTNGEADWAALVQPDRGRLELVTNIAMHVGVWRTMDRAEETFDESDAAQKRQRAAWAAGSA